MFFIKTLLTANLLTIGVVQSQDVDLSETFVADPEALISGQEAQSSSSSLALTVYIPPKIELDTILYPDEIYEVLVKSTIGQDNAMKQMAAFVHDHLVNLRMREQLNLDPRLAEYKDLNITKPNILMVGPTGTGKTYTIQTLAKLLKVPMVVGNATEWTTQGYIGSKWQYMFDFLYDNAKTLLKEQGKPTDSKSVVEAAQLGIVFIDEFDKICISDSELEVVSRVQQELLPPIQGANIVLSNGNGFDTSNVLFIAGGAFPNLKPINGKVITPHDLERFGMLPEVAGRLGNIVQLDNLSKDSLKKIMLASKGSVLTQITLKYKLAYGIELAFDEDALDYIAEIAALQNTGARSLNSMITQIMKDRSFNIRSHINKPMLITKKDAEKELEKFRPQKEEKNPSYLAMYT